MSLPENVANTNAAIATVATAALKTGQTSLKTSGAAPTALQAAGQFRIVIGTEILLVTGGAATTTWTVVRKEEGTTEAEHLIGAEIKHQETAGTITTLAKVPVVRTITTADSVKSYDENILANNSGAVTLTMAAAATFQRKLSVAAIGAGVLTIKQAAAETINGKASITVGLAEGAAEYTSVVLVSDGANYWVVG